MNIYEAAKVAIANGQYITRAAWENPYRFRIEPTDTPDCCVTHSDAMRAPRRGWQPKAGDLIADDWIAIEWIAID